MNRSLQSDGARPFSARPCFSFKRLIYWIKIE
jgi:hypothetical protein